MKELYVINSNGEKEPFSFRKVYRSLIRSGTSRVLAKEIAKRIEREAYPGIKTSDISQRIRKELIKRAPKIALKFNLKEGMKKLGPTGFPFEKYIGEIFLRDGFKVQLNQHVPGLCARYEIDFLAKKKNLLYIGECKYRHLPGGRVHLDVALANYARFLDIKRGGFFNKIFKDIKIKSLLVTNAKFTSQAIKYSKCVGVELLGWNYPRKKGLEYLIDKRKLYPVTILPSLKKFLADILVLKRMMLVEDLLKIDTEKFAKKEKISLKYLRPLIKEAKILLLE